MRLHGFLPTPLYKAISQLALLLCFWRYNSKKNCPSTEKKTSKRKSEEKTALREKQKATTKESKDATCPNISVPPTLAHFSLTGHWLFSTCPTIAREDAANLSINRTVGSRMRHLTSFLLSKIRQSHQRITSLRTTVSIKDIY